MPAPAKATQIDSGKLDATIVKDDVKPEVATAAEPAKKDVPVAPLRNFSFRESVSNRWLCQLPLGVTKEQASDPDYISRVLLLKVKDLSSFDEIFCLAADESWSTELLVVDAERTFLRVLFLRAHDLPIWSGAIEERTPPGFSIERERVSGEWTAYRLADMHPMVERCKTREECIHDLCEHPSFR